ncbi:MAG TPA: TonB-dependent receptor, partial [Accumulibacter sp.]|nr:TonB-dependent receptor [Accumulibacter sp.]
MPHSQTVVSGRKCALLSYQEPCMDAPHLRPKALIIALATVFQCVDFPPTFAAENESELPEIVVSGRKMPATSAMNDELNDRELAARRASVSDTAQLLRDFPGVASSSAGGGASLPVIRGLADDRLRIKGDGMDLISACGNHMNPPLSSIDPSRVEAVRVYSGIAPVSVGGDSIGGAIIVNSRRPRFAAAGDGVLTSGEFGTFYRSNGHAHGVNAAATLANENLSISYHGSTAEAGNYHAAGDFKPGYNATWTTAGSHWIAGNEVGSSAYKTENHALDLALRNGGQLLDLKLAVQRIPYQGFPNQHMDMTGNRNTQVNLAYEGAFDWGKMQARIHDEKTEHQMDFGQDKLYWYGAAHNVAGMPMSTQARNTGVGVRAEFGVSERDLFRIGGDYQRYRLDDWWSPVANSMMMSPDTFQNINNGQRDRFEVFGEWERAHSLRWSSLLGIRIGTVKMTAGNVQGYNSMPMMYGDDAARFNASNRSKTDHNLDLTALARYTPHAGQTYEAGYARKTRSPSLYERYTWSTNGMAMTMNNWVNDGNGYVGDVNLQPEVAHTLSFTADLHDGQSKRWGVKLSPYYSKADHYIDAR